MPLTKSRNALFALLLCLPVLATSGCRHKDYKEQVASFKKSVDSSASAITAIYQGLNERERDAYIYVKVYHQEQIGLEENHQPTILVEPTYKPASIEARLRLLRLLGTYAERLSQLSGLDAPGQFETNVSALGKSFGQLSNRFQTLSGSGDATAANYIQPLADIAGAIGREYLEAKRQREVERAIRGAYPDIAKLLAFLEKDLDKTGIETDVRLTQMLGAITTYYNGHVNSLTLNERLTLADEIKKASVAVEVARNTNPSDSVRDIEKAQAALLKYMERKDTGSLSDLVATLQAFQRDADKLVDAALRLHDASKG